MSKQPKVGCLVFTACDCSMFVLSVRLTMTGFAISAQSCAFRTLAVVAAKGVAAETFTTTFIYLTFISICGCGENKRPGEQKE